MLSGSGKDCHLPLFLSYFLQEREFSLFQGNIQFNFILSQSFCNFHGQHHQQKGQMDRFGFLNANRHKEEKSRKKERKKEAENMLMVWCCKICRAYMLFGEF